MSVNTEEMRRRAQAMTRPKVLKDGFYRFIVVDQRELPPKDDKPRTLVLDVAPLRDENESGSAADEFTQSLWLPLIGTEGVDPDERSRKQSVATLIALYPDRIDRFTKEGKDYFFQGNLVKGDQAFNAAQTEQLVQAMTISQELLEKTTTTVNKTFYAQSKAGTESSRVFINGVRAENTDNKPLDVPEAA